jgi:hypothetical protein
MAAVLAPVYHKYGKIIVKSKKGREHCMLPVPFYPVKSGGP